MDVPMFSRKRSLFDGYEKQPPLCKRKCLATLKTQPDRYETDRSDGATQHDRLKKSHGHLCKCEMCANGQTNLIDATGLSEQTSSWTDTQFSVKKVLEHLRLKQAAEDFFLSDSVNNRFLEFHRDITEECGTEDKQHSWAVIEKLEEVIMYGPYYPNYNKGEHSEDIIVKQTQEVLESEGPSEDWKVYIFTINSPCLSRNTEPCMLNLVHKAQEWWGVYGIRTHIGYVRCWGFKGTKETLFKDIDFRQVECINQSVCYESYAKAVERSTEFNPLCETVFAVAKNLLRSGRVNFPLMAAVHRQDWRSYFKSMHTIFESQAEDEKQVTTQEMNTMIEAAEVPLSGKAESFEEYLKRGQMWALDYTFSSQVRDAQQDQMRLAFQRCWREMAQDKYAEFIRERLTECFNRCTIQLFIKDILRVTEQYLQIGKLQFTGED